ncbi:hypothetical protein SCLCIDRAFT_127806, partial [Scleroderma citrinum Foug A]
VLANYKDNIITSLNCNFIPEPFCFKDDCIMPLRDGRFGLVDCFQWPQLHTERYIWSACIPQQVAYRDDPIWSILWWNMSRSPDEFVLERGSAFEVRRVHKSKFQQLEKVHRCLDECAQKWLKENPEYKGPLKLQEWVQCCSWALICLERLAFTFRDTVLVVTLFQCLALNVFSMLEWETTPITAPSSDFHLVINHWMGTFTTDFEVCQCLFDARVQVWLIRKESSIPSDMNVHKRIKVTPPPPQIS